MNTPPDIEVVAGIILDKKGKILLARRKEDDYPPDMWEFPGGKLENEEDACRALIREIREEFHLELTGVKPLTELFHYDNYKKRLIRFYLVCARIKSLETFVMRIHAEYAWVEFHALKKYHLAPADREMLAIISPEVCL